MVWGVEVGLSYVVGISCIERENGRIQKSEVSGGGRICQGGGRIILEKRFFTGNKRCLITGVA